MSKKPSRGGSKSRAKGNARSDEQPKASTSAAEPNDDLKMSTTDTSSDADKGLDADASAGSNKSSASNKDPEKASASKLPAFGFADEVLAARKTTEAAVESIASELDLGFTREEPQVEAVADMPEAMTGSTGAERVYNFADTVSDLYQDEQESAPKRITTWVTFDLANEIFAIPVEEVHEVLRVSTITRVPHAPHPIRGVTNLRGRVIPIIDLRVRIDLKAKEIDRTSRILVVHPRGRVIGLLVDAVRQVVHLDLDAVQSPPDDVMTVQSDYLTGVYQLNEELLLLLDVERALIIKTSGAA